MTSSPTKKRKCTVLPRSTVDYLKNWMMSPEHIAHPYPTEKEKAEIMAATGIEGKQLTNWFVNNRKRFWKPRVEARLQQHLQSQKAAPSISVKPQIALVGPCYNMNHQRSSHIQFRAVNMSQPVIDVKAKSDFSPIHTSFKTFDPPCSRDDTDNVNSQVVSMGSVSYASDSDNNSLANSSSDGNDERIFCSFSSVTKMSPQKHELQELGGPKIQLVSPSNDSMNSQPLTQKFNNSMNDPAFSSELTSENINFIVRPRSITLNSSEEAPTEPNPKKRCVSDWQTACRNACHGYDHSLPTLEEAATLFGFMTRKD